LLSILRRLVERTPVLVAIDDVQWLDRSSEAALAFALRRLESGAPLALVMALRVDERAPTNPLGFRELPASRSTRVPVGPLTLSALYHVMHERLGIVVPRPTLQRIATESEGNPLLALELARALAETGERPGPGEPLPVPDELVGLLASRLGKLSERSREAMLAAALLSEPRLALLDRAVDRPTADDLQVAVEADLVEIRGDRIRFAHPLIGGVLVSAAVPATRRAMHRRLAEIVESREERARHLALASEGPDHEVAAGLEEAAVLAAHRGAPEDASELLELAWRLTPEDDAPAAGHRRLAHARALSRAGDHGAATASLDGLLAEATSGPLRAQALELRAQMHWVAGTAKDAEECCTEALEHAGNDGELRARILVTRARVTLDSTLVLQRSREAVALLESFDEPDPSLLSEALIGIAGAEYYLGNGIPDDVVARALELERIAPPPNVGDRMSAALGTWLKYDGDFVGARHWLEITRQAALDEGDEGSLPYALSHLPQLELWTGNWERAEQLALEHLELAETTGQTLERLTAIFSLALIHAHMGRVDETRERVTDALVDAERADPWNLYLLLSVLGFLDLSRGAADEAVPPLARAFELYEATGAGDTPSVFENYAEALVAVGEVETARQVVELYESRAHKAGKAITRAPALRCRGLVLGAAGDLDAALTALDESLAFHEQLDMPFSRARTLVVHGQLLRRGGERRAARDALEESRSIFEELGAPLWVARARDELARIPIRRSSGTTLTPAESRVAELVAAGKSNGEVAQALFISRKTVEANLTRIYRKLGVGSRAALAARMREADEDPALL
jgi:DNA-binding CsgD family transcriptional regulator